MRVPVVRASRAHAERARARALHERAVRVRLLHAVSRGVPRRARVRVAAAQENALRTRHDRRTSESTEPAAPLVAKVGSRVSETPSDVRRAFRCGYDVDCQAAARVASGLRQTLGRGV